MRVPTSAVQSNSSTDQKLLTHGLSRGAGTLDIISELVGYSRRKNHRWFILGNVPDDFEWPVRGENVAGSRKKE